MAGNIPPPVAVEELLLKTLRELVNPEMETFKFYLKVYSEIPAMNLSQDTTREQVVQVLVQYKRDQAVSATITILRKMDKNHLANQLSTASGVQG